MVVTNMALIDSEKLEAEMPHVKSTKYQPSKLALPSLNGIGLMGGSYLDSPLFLPVITVEPSPTTGIQHLIPPLFQSNATRTTLPEKHSISPRTTSSVPTSALPSPLGKPGKQSAANDDGYQWRKYGEKIVKGNAFPRSYYKCSYQGCSAKKIIERNNDHGYASAEYKGQHNHPAPHSVQGFGSQGVTGQDAVSLSSFHFGIPVASEHKAERDSLDTNGGENSQLTDIDEEEDLSDDEADLPEVPLRTAENDSKAAQMAVAQLRKAKEEDARRRTFTGLPDCRAADQNAMAPAPKRLHTLPLLSTDPFQALSDEQAIKQHGLPACSNDLEPQLKRPRQDNNENVASEEPGGKRSVTQTVTDASQLDDGYKWRKYGQKTVKSNPNPRSYYKCTAPGCTCRKHVERCVDDAQKLTITYEGEHNHPPPSHLLGRSSIRRLASTLPDSRVFVRRQSANGNEADAPAPQEKAALPPGPFAAASQPMENAAGWTEHTVQLAAKVDATVQHAAQRDRRPKLSIGLPVDEMAEESIEQASNAITVSGAMTSNIATHTQKLPLAEALGTLDTPTGMAWLDGCLTTPKPTSPTRPHA